jgi:hypothetical protein
MLLKVLMEEQVLHKLVVMEIRTQEIKRSICHLISGAGPVLKYNNVAVGGFSSK